MNIVVFISDALRADHLSCYGYHRDTTPHIDAFAENHTLYRNAFTPSTWTRSAAASLLTGTYPSIHGVETLDDYFGSELPRWPQLLADAGYYTAGISAIGNVSSGLGFDRGFDEFVDLYKDETLDSRRTTSTAEEEMLEHEFGRVVFPLAEQVLERFERTVLQQDSSGPFFAFLWTIDPHDPYQPPEEFRTFVDSEYSGSIDGSRDSLRRASTDEDFQRLINLYDSEISYTDHAFQQFLDLLKQYGEYDDTLVVFAGDHGEAFGDHNRNVGHSNIPYEELLHVPVVVRYPHDQPEWSGTDELFNLIDLMPTTLKYAGIEWDSSLPDAVGGRTLLSEGRKNVFSETHYSDVQNTFYSVRQPEWKYINIESPNSGIRPYLEMLTDIGFMKQFLTNPLYFLKRRFGDSPEHLYDLQHDPGEANNLVDEDQHEQYLRQLRQELASWRTELEAVDVDEETSDFDGIDEQTERQLREMGYLE